MGRNYFVRLGSSNEDFVDTLAVVKYVLFVPMVFILMLVLMLVLISLLVLQVPLTHYRLIIKQVQQASS